MARKAVGEGGVALAGDSGDDLFGILFAYMEWLPGNDIHPYHAKRTMPAQVLRHQPVPPLGPLNRPRPAERHG